MKNKLILCCLLAGLSFAGCKRHSSKSPEEKPAEQPAAGAIATPPPVAKAEPVAPAPAPKPVAKGINKNAVAICLCYHNIEDGKSKALTISVAEFEKEMQEIKDNGFTVIGLQDFLAWRRGEKDIPAKCAIITLDDGWASAYTTAWPILKKFNYPFTLFIYINYVNSGGKSMTWDQLAEMRDAGVDIESHTYSHGDLRSPLRATSVDKRTMGLIKADIAALGQDGWMRKEIVESKRALEKQLGIKVNAIAYPFGNYNKKVLEIVKEGGYEAGFTVYGRQLHYSSPGFDSLGRYAIDAKDPKLFENAMKMIGGGEISGPVNEPLYAQVAAASMITQPMSSETIGTPTPLIKANLATFGQVDPASVKMRISGLGMVPAKYDAASKTVSFQVTQKLKDPSYTVIISAVADGKRVETQWNFNYDATGKKVGPAPSAPLPPQQ